MNVLNNIESLELNEQNYYAMLHTLWIVAQRNGGEIILTHEELAGMDSDRTLDIGPVAEGFSVKAIKIGNS